MLETEINILVDEFVFNNGYNPVEHIKSRIKSEKIIKNKLKDKGYDYTLANIKKYIHPRFPRFSNFSTFLRLTRRGISYILYVVFKTMSSNPDRKGAL